MKEQGNQKSPGKRVCSEAVVNEVTELLDMPDPQAILVQYQHHHVVLSKDLSTAKAKLHFTACSGPLLLVKTTTSPGFAKPQSGPNEPTPNRYTFLGGWKGVALTGQQQPINSGR